MAATILVSLACAMQVQTFRKVDGYSYASTMCIGNLRSGTAAISVYMRERKPEQLRQALYYFGIITILQLEQESVGCFPCVLESALSGFPARFCL